MFRPIASSLHLPSAHVALIDDSHERCAALGLSRFESPDLSPISMSELAVLRDRNQRLHAHAAPVMEMLFEQIVHTQSMVVLCDATGTVLHAVGDDDFLARADKVALAPGANWSEASKGTNGIGTALIAEEPTLVHADEHFVHANHFLTCSAAPIFDPRGNILGVLDVSGDQRSFHQHTMALVKMSARMIENHWLSDDYRHVMRLHFHNRVEFIGTLKEGILAVTAEGRIAGANHSALGLLGQSGAALRMQSLPMLLGVTVGDLVDHFRSPLATPFISRTTDGRAFHLFARFDWPVWHTIAEAAGAAAATAAGAGFVAAKPVLTGAAAGDDVLDDAALAGVPRTWSDHGGAPAHPARLRASSGGGGVRDAAAIPGPAALARSGTSAVPSDADPAPANPWHAWTTGDAAVAALIDKLERVVDRQVAIVLHGDVGSGKETLARAIHRASRRRGGPFIAVRCDAMPEAALAAELFGDARSPGKIAQAHAGTLLLSEVSELPREIQARLLHALQDGDRCAPGSRHVLPIDTNLVTASRLDARAFRDRMNADRAGEALYYRLNGLALKLPALRDRSDVLALAQRILAAEVHAANDAVRGNATHDAVRGNATHDASRVQAPRDAARGQATLSPDVAELLHACPWPGNVRQLVNVLRAAFLVSGGGVIRLEHLPDDFVESCAPRPAANVASAPGPAGLMRLEAMEIEAIEAAVRACGGNISEASKRLGISRNTIYRRLRWKDKRA